MNNSFYDLFRLPNEEIRPSSSAQDLSMAVRESGAKVSVPFKVGTKVFYIEMTEATVTEENGIAILDLTAGTGDKAAIFAPAINMMF